MKVVRDLQERKAASSRWLLAKREAAVRRFESELADTRVAAHAALAQLDHQLQSFEQDVSSSSNYGDGPADTESSVLDGLRKRLVSQADEHYFGPALRDALIQEGITTAADISADLFTNPAIGPLRGSAVMSWRRAVEKQIRASVTRSASTNGKLQRSAHEQKKAELLATREALEVELARLESESNSRRSAEVAALDQRMIESDRAFDTELARVTAHWIGVENALKRRLQELGNHPHVALWANRVATQKKRLARIEMLLVHTRGQLGSVGTLRNFIKYLRCL
ncbi:MAG TPA: hypothetical protein VFG68_18940 [Fimbriiglobus sp.]|nr:hypothetical protein [Fimbriiglobus sp.]